MGPMGVFSICIGKRKGLFANVEGTTGVIDPQAGFTERVEQVEPGVFTPEAISLTIQPT